MKHIKKYLLAVFAMILLLSLCACNTLPTDTTGGDGGNSSDPIAALKNFDQGSKIYVKVDEGNAWYVDYAVLSNSDGDKVSEICAGAMSYAELDLNKYSITVDGKAATADTIVKAGGKLILTNKTPAKVELKDGEFQVAFELYEPNSGREQGMYFACTPNTALKNFFEANITEGRQTYDDFAKDYDMYVNGKKASGGTVLTADAYIFGYYTKKIDSGNNGGTEDGTITVKFDCTYADGKVESDSIKAITKGGKITLDDFIKQYTRLESFTASTLRGTWTLNGTVVIGGDVEISDGSALTYIQRIEVSKSIVTLRVVYSEGWDEEVVAVEGKSLTLRDLVEKYVDPGCSFEDSLNTVHFTYNGKPADADTVIEAGTTVFAIRNDAEVAEPGEGEVKLGIIITEPESGMKRGLELIVPEGEYTLAAFFDTYVTEDPGSFEESWVEYDWYVDGEPATADTKITETSEITAVMKRDPAGQPDPLPPPEEGMSVTVIFQIAEDSYKNIVVSPYTASTLADFYNDSVINVSPLGKQNFEETLKNGTWTLNGVKATADTVVKDGDELVYRLNANADLDITTITFTVKTPYGNTSNTIDVIGSITIGEFFAKYIAAGSFTFEDFLADGTCTVDGKEITDPNYPLRNGVELVYTVKGLETTGITVYYVTVQGNTWTQMEYTVSDVTEITLGEFFATILSNGGDIEDTYEEYDWFVDDEKATASTAITDYSTVKVVECAVPPVEPGEDEFAFDITFYQNDYGISYGATLIASKETMELKALYELYCKMNGSSEYDFETFEWYVDGEYAEHDTVVTAGQYIEAALKENSGDIDPPVEGFGIELQYITANGYTSYTMLTIPGYTELSLGEVFKLYLYDRYGNFDNYEWSVDGKTVEMSFILCEGMTLTIREKSDDIDPVEKFSVLVTLTDYTGTTYFETEFYIEGTCIALYDFYVTYLRDDLGFAFDDFGWEVNGYQVTDGKEALLIKGDQIVMTYPGIWGAPVTKQFEVLFTYIDANGDEFTNGYGISGYADLEIEKFFKLYLSMSYGGNASDYTWTVDGKVVDIYFILSDGMDVIMRDLGTAEKPEGISVQVEFTDFSGDIIVKEVIAIGYTDSIDLYTLYKEFIQNTVGDYAFEEFLWGINGMESGDKDIVRDGDYIVMVPRVLLPDPPVVEEIEVTVVVTENGETNPVTMAVPAGSTIADVLLELLGSDAETLEAYFLFDINGERVDINAVLNNGDVLTLTSRFEAPPAEGEITVYFQETLEGDEKVPYIISANSTLYDCLVLLGIPEDYLKTADFYVNGTLTGINTVLYEGDVIYISEKGTAPADVIVIHVSIYSDNTLMNQIPVEVVGYTEISISTFLKEYIEYLELYDGTFQCLVNGVEVNDPDYMLYNGDKVSFYKTSVDIPVDPPVDQGFTVYVSVMSGAGLDGMTYSYWVEVAPISIEDLYWKYMQQDGIFAEISLDVCEWMVNKEPADRYTQLNGMCDLQLIIHTESACEHNWGNADGYCSNCGEPCPEYDAHFDAYLFTSCPTCGYSTNGGAMQQTIVYVLQNGMEMSYVFTTMPGTYPTIDDVLMQAFGQNLDLMRDKGAVIWHDGIEITDKFYQVTGGRIEVTTQEIVEPPIDDPMQEYPIYFSRYYYTAMGTDEEGNEILGEWWNNDKSGEWWMWGGEYSLRDILYSVGLDFSDTDAVFVNGERVYDLGSTFTLDDTCYIVCLDERIPFDGLTVTVYNEVNGEERTYKYEAPMFYAQIRDQIFAGLDMGSLDFNYEAFLNGAVVDVWGLNEYRPLVLDCRFVLRERVTYVSAEVVDAYGDVANRNFEVVGAMPTVADFVNQHIGSFDAYRVFDIGGGTLRELFAEDQMRECYVVILPKALIKDSITVTYDLTFANDMGRYQGSFTLASPVLLATAFEQFENAEFNANDIWWNAYMYDICVNGVTLTDDKGAHYTLLWQDVTITACPVYTFRLALENMGGMPTFDPVKVNDPNTTFSELFKMFGIDNTDLFLFEYPMTDTVGMHFEYGDHSLYIRPKTVDIEFAIVDLHGNRLDARIEVPAPISVEQLISYMKNNGYYFEGELADFRCTVTDYGSSEKFDVLDGSYVFKYSEDGYYGLYLECKQMFVNVEVMDANGMWITSHYSVTVEREWTLVQIAESVGCSVDDILRYATNYSGNVSAQERMAPNETLYIYTNSFTLYVTLYGTPDGDAYHTIENMRGGQMTVGNVLASLGYDWSMVATATLEGHDFGSMQVYADTVIESGSHLYFYFAEKQEFTVYINVFNGYGEVTYSNQLWFTEPISMADLLAQCGYSWDQVSYGYNFAGDITMDTVISQEDKIDIYLIANSEMQSFSVNVVFFNYQGEETDRYTFDSMAEPITVGNLLANCGYSWDVVESGYSQSFASSVTVDSVINQNDTIEIKLLPREAPIFITVFNSALEIVYESEIYVPENIVYYAPNLIKEIGFSWDQVDYGYYSGGTLTENSIIGADDKVEIYLVAETVDVVA